MRNHRALAAITLKLIVSGKAVLWGIFLLSYLFFLYNLKVNLEMKSDGRIKLKRGLSELKDRGLLITSSSDDENIKRELFQLRDLEIRPIIVKYKNLKQLIQCDVPCQTIPYSLSIPSDSWIGRDTFLSMGASSLDTPVSNSNKQQMGTQKHNNIAMTTSLSSDVPVGYFSWDKYHFMHAASKKTEKQHAIVVLGKCDHNSLAFKAISQIENLGISIAKFGACFGVPEPRNIVETFSKFKFVLAFEQVIEVDFVTSFYFRALESGSIPVVIGAPNIKQFEPQLNSVLHITSLSSIPEVVDQMKRLSLDTQAYNDMLSWKRSVPSESFISLVDLSTVHSLCRLCTKIADRLWLNMVQTHIATETSGNQLDMAHSVKCLYGKYRRIFLRERGRFFFHSILIDVEKFEQITTGTPAVELFLRAIKQSFESRQHVPVWHGKRPDFFNSKIDLNIYRVYWAHKENQHQALYERESKVDYGTIKSVIHSNCAHLEVIFI